MKENLGTQPMPGNTTLAELSGPTMILNTPIRPLAIAVPVKITSVMHLIRLEIEKVGQTNLSVDHSSSWSSLCG